MLLSRVLSVDDRTWKFYSGWELLLDSYSNTTILVGHAGEPGSCN